MSALVLLPDIPCLDCISNGWERACPDCWVDAGFTRRACGVHQQPCPKHQVQSSPVVDEPPAPVVGPQLAQEPPTRWVASRYRGEIRYERGLFREQGSYETRAYIDGCPSDDHSAPTRAALIEALKSRYPDYHEVPDDGRPFMYWLSGDVDICKTLDQALPRHKTKRPKDRRQKKARKKAEAIDRRVEAADMQRRVARGVAAGLASSAKREAKEPPLTEHAKKMHRGVMPPLIGWQERKRQQNEKA